MRGIDIFKRKDDGIREPTAAGSFYPGDPEELRSEVDTLLSKIHSAAEHFRVIGLISPHAGYPYSGAVAARAYAPLREQEVRSVILVAPCHVESFSGASVYQGRSYRTPLGEAMVDRHSALRLADHPGVQRSDLGHRILAGRGEHSLEVQLPFLQRVAPQAEIVPVVMGEQSFETCRRLGLALADVADPGTVLVASSDLSHFHPDAEARQLDRSVLDAVSSWDYFSLASKLETAQCEACGGGPIIATMIAARRLGADRAELLGYATSGEIPPFQKDGVVGYLAAAFRKSGFGIEPPYAELGPGDHQRVLQIARTAVEAVVARPEETFRNDLECPSLQRPAAIFVTLRVRGELRGCIGSTVATVTIAEAVETSAVAAARSDPRFTSIQPEELPALEIDVSILSPFRLILGLEEIDIGRDGLYVEKGPHRGLLLPQVALEHGWDKETFAQQTCAKAGLPRHAWQDPETLVQAFSTLVLTEQRS